MATEFVCAGCRLIYPDSELAAIGNGTCADCTVQDEPAKTHTAARSAIEPVMPLTIQRMAKWLADHVPTIMLSDFAAELVDEINDAIANAWRAVDRPADKHLLGPCGAETESGECTELVYAIERQTWALCRSCGIEHDVRARKGWLKHELDGVRGTAAQLAALLPWFANEPITRKRITYYARGVNVGLIGPLKAGAIRPYLDDETQETVYRADEVIAAHEFRYDHGESS